MDSGADYLDWLSYFRGCGVWCEWPHTFSPCGSLMWTPWTPQSPSLKSFAVSQQFFPSFPEKVKVGSFLIWGIETTCFPEQSISRENRVFFLLNHKIFVKIRQGESWICKKMWPRFFPSLPLVKVYPKLEVGHWAVTIFLKEMCAALRFGGKTVRVPPAPSQNASLEMWSWPHQIPKCRLGS